MSDGYRAVCRLTLDGTDIAGHNDFTTLGGEDVSDSFEIHELDWGFERNVTGAARLSGQTSLRRVRFVKRIDAATPLISQGLDQGATAEAVFKIFDNGPDGADRLLYTITVSQGRLTGQALRHRTNPERARTEHEHAITHGTQEEVFLAFTTMAQAHSDPATESEISWGGGARG